MTGFRQVSIVTASNQVELLEELLFLADAQAVTLVDHGDAPIFEPPLSRHPVWPQTQVQALYDNERPESQILSDLKTYFQRANLLIEPPSHLTLVPDQDWVRISLNQFRLIQIGSFWVKPSWNEDPIPAGLTTLNIDPRLAFGTGMHPTTRLCLEWLGSHPLSGKTVMDFGCGSGILAIAAGCVGACQIAGLDIDPQALIATSQNASLNQLPIQTLLAENTPDQTFDVVVTNILANPLIELSAALIDLIQLGGHIVTAGLLHEQSDQVKAAYPSIVFDEDISKDEWTRLSGRRSE